MTQDIYSKIKKIVIVVLVLVYFGSKIYTVFTEDPYDDKFPTKIKEVLQSFVNVEPEHLMRYLPIAISPEQQKELDK